MRNEKQDPEPPSSVEELTAALEQMPAWEVDTIEEPPTGVTEAVHGLADVAPPLALASNSTEMNENQPPPLNRILESLLFVGGSPLSSLRAAEVVRGLSEDDFHRAVEELNRTYRTQGRPYHIQLQANGYVLSLRSRFQAVREKLFGGVREARLSQAAVDVLSLVAYRQPATRQEIDSLRGADSGAVLRLLIRHGLVAIQRGEDREIYYGTTARFLQLFGLTSLDDLPQTQDLQRL